MSTAAAKPATEAPPKKRFSIGKILLTIVGVLIGLAAAFAIYVATRPDDYQISRSATIDAAPETVFNQINDFRKWEAWSPWAPLDPNAKNTFEGPESGEGAKFHWSGNDKIGEGEMTILDSQSPEHIQIKLEFMRPMQDSSLVDFTIQPTEKISQSRLTWSMTGKYPNFTSKAFCTAMNMPKMLGQEFDKGLAGIKSIAEKETGPVP
jgi:hypothetical protein